ncbi:hypothetical protein EI94DRAFT_1701207 [Lactarius quietus]|nr:hypothetical protein EI94DRAFT_1701207 [Lactarius quietus]
MGKRPTTHKARPSNGLKPRIHAENVVLNLCNESLEKAYNKLVASRGTMPNTVTEDLEEPTPSEDRTNYPNIIYWYKHEQLAERRHVNKTGCSMGPWLPIVGRMKTRQQVRKTRAKAKSQWLALCKKYGDVGLPWTNVSPNYQLEFFVKMEYKFPLLHLCDGHYKTEAVAFADYSHWHSKNKFEYMCRSKTTMISHSKTKMQTTSKSESDTDADLEVNQSRKSYNTGRWHKRRMRTQMRTTRTRTRTRMRDDDDKVDDKVDDDDKNAIAPQATPTEAMPPEATPTVATPPEATLSMATPPEATPTAATPPEATLSMVTPLRATTPGQITVASEVMQASAKATNETHKQQELDAKGAAKSSSA